MLELDYAQIYLPMIREFLSGASSTKEFTGRFTEEYMYGPHWDDHYPEAIFNILERLFGYVETYDPETSPGSETAFEESEQSLRRASQEAATKLTAYVEPAT